MDVLQYLLLSAAEDTQMTLLHSEPSDGDEYNIHVLTVTDGIFFNIIPVHAIYN